MCKMWKFFFIAPVLANPHDTQFVHVVSASLSLKMGLSSTKNRCNISLVMFLVDYKLSVIISLSCEFLYAIASHNLIFQQTFEQGKTSSPTEGRHSANLTQRRHLR
jgi:hypothetical protein